MKQTVIALIAAFILSPIAMLAGTTESAVITNPPAKQYTGYWVVTCGSEKIVLSEATIPEEALERDANGELVHLNMDVLDKTFNYSYQSTIQGKQVTANQFVLVEKNETAQLNVTLNTWTAACKTGDNLCWATLTCYQPSTTADLGWRANPSCGGGNSYCRAYDFRGNLYIIACR